MLFQNDPKASPVVRDRGCAFLHPFYWGEKHFGRHYNIDDINSFWEGSISSRIISGDLDNSGKIDKPNEGVIQSWDRLFQYLDLPIRAVIRTDENGELTNRFPPSHGVPPGMLYSCAWGWYNPEIKKSIQHFVIGLSRPVEYDPWYGGSRTVRYGAPLPDGLRLFQIIGGSHGA